MAEVLLCELTALPKGQRIKKALLHVVKCKNKTFWGPTVFQGELHDTFSLWHWAQLHQQPVCAWQCHINASFSGHGGVVHTEKPNLEGAALTYPAQ